MATGNLRNKTPKGISFQPGPGFAALFITAALLAAWGMTPLFRPAQRLTIAITTFVGELLGLTITGKGDILTVNGFAMRIAEQCTCLNYVMILALAMLLYNRHPFLYRIKGIVVATGIMLFANAFRLISLGLAGTISFKLFSMLHEYVWVAAFAPLVFIIWKLWADRSFAFDPEKIRLVSLAACGFLAAIFVLFRFSNEYCRLLALLANPIFKFLMGDFSSTVAWNGTFNFQHGRDVLQAGINFDEYTLALYIGLMLPYVWRNRKAAPLALLGLSAQLVFSSAGIAILGVIGMIADYANARTFMYISSGLSLALPIACYWIVTSMARTERGVQPCRAGAESA